MSVDDRNDMTPKWGVDILIAIERLDAKIGSNDERHSQHQVWAERNIKDHELRIRALEQFRWAVAGISAIGGSAAAGVLVAIIKAVGA